MTGFSFPTNKNGEFPGYDDIVYTPTSNDAMTEAFGVIAQAFILFPEFSQDPLWIAGESYGGVYIANLGNIIHNHNMAGASAISEHLAYNSKINFAGKAHISRISQDGAVYSQFSFAQ